MDNAPSAAMPVSAPALANPAGLPATAAPAIPTPSDAATVASTTASLPPPAMLPGSTIVALSPPAGAGTNLSRSDFVRAIWVDAQKPALRTPEGIKKLVADCRDAGFDTIYAQVRANGDALYATTLAPTAVGLAPGYDGLKLLLEEAKAGSKPLHVHALLVVYRVWSSSADASAEHVTKQHPEWLTVAEDGSKALENGESWLDPGVTAVQDHLALIATDLVKNYAVEGIQLDRIRYPELDPKTNPNAKLLTGYSQAAVDRYNQEKGKTGKPKPTDADWVAWRRDQVTETVRKIREAVRAVRPNVQISAGAITFGAPPHSREEYVSQSAPYTSVLEDWVGWGEKGLVDTNVLMNFKAVDRGLQADFEAWQDFALANKGKAKMVIGIGGFLNDPRYTAAQMLLPVFQPKADGVALYSYNDTYRDTPYDRDLSFVRPVLEATALNLKSADVAAAVAKPLEKSTPLQEQLAKLDASAAAAGINAPVTQTVAAAAPAAAVIAAPVSPLPGSSASTVASLPQLGASSSAPIPNMPALGAASSNLPPSGASNAMPSLPGTAGSTASTGAGGLPSLSAAIAGSTPGPGSMPTLPGASAAAAPGMPSLPGPLTGTMPSLSTAAAGPGAVNSMPALPGGTTARSSLPALPGNSTTAALPPLTDVVPGASANSPIPPLSSITSAGTPNPFAPSGDTSIASVPSLPSLSAPALPSTGVSGSVAILGMTPESQKVIPESPIAPLSTLGTPAPGVHVEVPSFAATSVSPFGNVSVTVEPPVGTPIMSLAPIPGGAPTTTLSVPGTSANTSVNIPSLGGSTNFDGKAIGAAAPASPLITPPTILTPAPGYNNEGQPINVGKQTVLDAPQVQRMDFSERQSAYGTPNPANEIRNFTTANIRKERQDLIAMPPSPAPLEVVVLKSGKEFAGRVLQRGTVWRIQLPNGSIMNLPGEKIASTRSTESAPQNVNSTPVPL